MSLTAHPSLPGVWIARYYPDGRKKDPKTGKASNKRDTVLFEGDKAAALSWYAGLCRTAKKPEVSPLAPSILSAWPQFCLYYENEVAASTYNDYLKTWDLHLKKWWGQYRPHQITPALVDTYKQQRLKSTSKRGTPPAKKTINKELSYISAMVSWMARPEINLCLPMAFAIKGYPAKQIKAPLPLVPTRAEIISLLRCTEKPYRAIFAACYYGGLRKTEALRLTSENINISQGYMIIKGKGSKQRIVPIHHKLKIYLAKKPKKSFLWLNPNTGRPYTDLKRPLERAAKKSDISQHVYMHLLRHGFGTHAIQSGVNLRSLQILMGHSSSQTTEIYTTLAATFLTEEVNRIGKRSAPR